MNDAATAPNVVRFAPSPTGQLHIGGARTALYNWLLARGSGGKLILRIEDTDRVRSTPENVAQIIDAMEWLGLDWDEGPLSQAARIDRHKEVIEQLKESGHAYVEEGATRLRVPNEGETIVHDDIRGDVVFKHEAIDDFTIARSDGSPLYNLAVAVDDLDSGVTHVVRGEDHLSNTPRQVMILNALGHAPPIYGHLPLLHGPDGKKLSKRHGAASVQELREAGYLPEAVRNYLALLGWGYDDKQTMFSTEELVKLFSLDRVSKSAAVFDEQKLRWMNGVYLREMPAAELAGRIEQFTGREGLTGAVELSREKIQTLADFWPLAGFFFDGPAEDEKARKKFHDETGVANLAEAREALANTDPFTTDAIEESLRGVVDKLDAKPNKVFQPIRVAFSGTTISPGIFESLELLGRDESLSRIDEALRRGAIG
ncbi:MAG TPA: glutamate--tRNA ligase [Solirubrobacterales bacterium]|jgi:glutamyl-tRNA synthetase|nr:glutamate--tRNA ligase [Solirubrobacterales bacterium]